jgi:flagellar motor protein MotB
MSPSLRRRLIKIGALSATLVIIGTVAAVAVSRSHPADNVTFIAVEPRSPSALVEADLAGELGEAENAGGDVILSAIANQSAAPALDIELGCPAETDPISCNQDRQRQSATIQQVADNLASAPHPATVDLYASFSQLSGYLAESPSKHAGTVTLFVNTLGDASIPQDLSTADLADPSTVAALARQAVAEGAFPGPRGCAGWRVHMVVPASADPAHDLGLHQLLSTLISGCGGSLASWSERWLEPSGSRLALPPIPPGVSVPKATASRPTFSLPDTFFAVGSAAISLAGHQALSSVATAIEARYAGQTLTCDGSADGTGGSSPSILAYDKTLSTVRAAAVCDELVADGVPQDLATPTGLGQITTEPDAAARAVRIEIGSA